jgi:tetrahydromethanopterin S-methyltransferase subunit B
MKDLIFVTAYCPTEEQVVALEKCIDSVLKCGNHIALISHTHIPIHIQKKCQYYVYDYLNEISDDYNLFGNNFFGVDNIIINSKFIQKSFYGFAIYRMFSIASQLAINFGYKNIHHIEYDCELLDETLISEHSSLLETYDSILYTDTGNKDGFIFGSLKSFKVETLPDNFKNYNRDFIESEMRLIDPKHLEAFTKSIFINSGNVLFKHVDEITEQKFKKGPKFVSIGRHYTLYYNDKDKTLNVFYRSLTDNPENIVVIVNDNKIVRLNVSPRHWYMNRLGIFDEINYVRIDDSKKTLLEKHFDNEFREIFKKESYITLT